MLEQVWKIYYLFLDSFFLGVKEGVNLVYLYWFTQYIYIISFLFGGGDGYSNISVSIYS